MRTAAAVLLALILALPVFAASRSVEPVPAASRVPPVGDSPTAQLDLVRRLERQRHVRPILDVLLHPQRPVRPVVPVPTPRLVVVRVHAEPQPSSHRASGTASYCAPTPRYCHGWGGDAHLAAVESFRYGDARYTVRVCGTKGCTTVTVVSYGVLPKGRIIDLSPAAFEEACGPLWMGVCRVKVTGLR